MHIVPKRKGDSKNPKGGVRGVIPENKNIKSKLSLKTAPKSNLDR